MSAVTQYRCEMCGTESSNPLHWFMIRCNANELKVLKWNFEEASMPDTRHYCGEAHAGVYISRWLEASCSPSRPDYNRPSATYKDDGPSTTISLWPLMWKVGCYY